MNEMEKAQILHKLKQGFNVSDEIFNDLLNQIENSNYKDNFSRITKGLTVEDNYKFIFSSLPWVKNINGLDQNQIIKHKKEYQVPDYSLLVENSEKTNFPILVDVKSVKGDKKSCTIIPKQKHTLRNYAKDHKQELLIAVFWEKYGFWTHNTLLNFSGKHKNKITIEDAIKNDLSHIFSDYIFFIDKIFYRKTKFIKNGNTEMYNHPEYGVVDKVFLGSSLETLEEYSLIESSIVDAVFTMNEIEIKKEEDNIIYQTEIFNGTGMIIKLTSWLVKFLNLWQLDYSYKVDNEILILEYARIFIVNLMHELKFKNIYLIPNNKNDSTLSIFELAYKDTTVMNDYLHGN